MIRIPSSIRMVALILLLRPWLAPDALAQEAKKTDWIQVTVKAGAHDRNQTPVHFELAEDRLGPLARKALDDGPIGLYLVANPDKGGELPKSIGVAQVVREPGRTELRGNFVLPVTIPAGKEAGFGIQAAVARHAQAASSPIWTLSETTPGALDLKLGDKPVFRYNAKPVSSPNYGPIQNRDAYLHPAYSPSGALVTGDFSSSHPHHRGFFLAYERTKTGELTPDFWNIHYGSGKIYSEGFDKPVVGPVTAKFSTRHRWDAKDKATVKDVTVLRERWDVEAYAIPDAPYWLFDVTSTQQAVGRPLELLPYRYGGMAYRGPEPFVKGTLDVLTSEGLHRKDGDQKPARWVDLTGPMAEGSDKYAGAMIADNPSNPNYPNVARIHPTSLPFFCYVPSHDKPLTIAVDGPSVFRYRVLIHDGHPDKDLDDRIWRDFAEPPVVVVE